MAADILDYFGNVETLELLGGVRRGRYLPSWEVRGTDEVANEVFKGNEIRSNVYIHMHALYRSVA
jgi:hypothetical protein